MTIEKLDSEKPVVTLTPCAMEGDHVFIISIERLVTDIEKSVKDPNTGYLTKLKKNEDDLLGKFEHAIKQIYSLG